MDQNKSSMESRYLGEKQEIQNSQTETQILPLIQKSAVFSNLSLKLKVEQLLTFVWQVELFDTCHVHFKMTLVAEQVLTVVGSPIRLIGS